MLHDSKIQPMLATTNPEAAKRFYGDLLGLRLLEEDRFALTYDGADVPLRLSKVSAFTPQPFTALGWRVPDLGASIGWQGRFVAKQERVLPVGSVYRLPPSKGYALHTLFASWNGKQGVWRGTEVRLTVDNVFNRNYMPYLSEAVTGVGRNAKLSVSRKF